MRIIIAGAGEVGSHLAKMLSHENHDIVLVDPDEHKLKVLGSNLDLLTLEGSATSLELLTTAGANKCDLFIAVTQTEEINITASVLAKRLGAKKRFPVLIIRNTWPKRTGTFLWSWVSIP